MLVDLSHRPVFGLLALRQTLSFSRGSVGLARQLLTLVPPVVGVELSVLIVTLDASKPISGPLSLALSLASKRPDLIEASAHALVQRLACGVDVEADALEVVEHS